ncbi:MAG: SusC/RagA family TonB-linked outer membrane protein, partial [Saprospiraceae bacterium]|nr:SusC/RagA family TonB-linked outer membrane protein [Saprospiraceae bacterium]
MVNRHHSIYRITLMLFVSMISLTLLAQRDIQGTVTDATTGEPLIGANLLVKGTLIGTATDIDGSYLLTVPEGSNILVVSYTGYAQQEIELTDANELNITLSAGEILDEIVVIGYGTIQREDATGSIQSVSSESFNKGAIVSAQELLAGKVPGVSITTDGAPGAGSSIRIRGESSLTATNDPLIVIDGVPIDNGDVSGGRNPLSVINPNDIETFTVLKDASASAIYGNRAAGGVIIITTKKGKVGDKLKVGYSGNVNFGTRANSVDVLTADEFRATLMNHYAEDHPARALLGDQSTNWQDEIYQTAVGHDHNLYLSGSLSDLPYRVSLGYTDKDGILKTDNFNRWTAGVNLNPGFLDNTLQLNVHFKGMLTKNNFADRGAIGNALGFDPTRVPYDDNSQYGGFTTWTIANGNPNSLSPTNPVALLEQRNDESTVRRYLTNVSADYRFTFLPELRANLNLAYDYSKGEGTIVVPTNAAFAFDAINGGGVNNEYEQTKENSLLELYFNYKKDIEKHGLDLMAGYSWQHFYVDNYFRNSDAAGTISETTEGSDPAEYYLLSMYGRINYSYDDRYLLTMTLRRDGTSRFAPENRWGLFPAAALAVKVIDNDNEILNSIKVRAGWGITGQQDIGDYYAYLARYQLSFDNARYQFGNQFITTIRPNGYDANIKWEETETFNLGVDYSIINGRLSGSIDLYQRNTKDLLNRIPVPAGTNLTNFVTTNIGSMENTGIELAFTTKPVLTEKIDWDLGVNLSYNQNEITRLTAIDDPTYEGILTGGIAGGVGSNIQIHSVGFAPRSFYVYEQILDESGNIIEGEFVDQNGDGLINELDKYRYKKPAADYTIGFTSRVGIGNFDLSFAGRSSIGNYVYNNVQTDMGYLNRIYGTTGVLWNVNQSAVDNNAVDQANLTFSDYFVRRADFLRLDHITAGYNFNDLIGSFSRVYVTVQNPVLITKYDGLDPEIFGGIDNNIYPRPRTF